MTKVSIIVPVYNPPEEYLKICIDSIINQTYQNLDIILVDNESTGNNSKILKDYSLQDDRINLIIFDKNKGFAGAVNAGFNAVKGEFLAIIDSDDWIEANAIEKLVNKMQNTDLDMTIFCANTFDEKLQQFTNEPQYTFAQIPQEFDNSYFNLDDICENLLLIPTQAWTRFYKTEFILRNQNYINEEQGTAGADALFTYNNLINAKKIGILRDKLYNYRTNLTGGVVDDLKHKKSKNFLMSMTLFKNIDKLITDKNLNHRQAQAFIQINIFQILLFFNFVHKSHKRVYYNQMRKIFLNLSENIYTGEQLNCINQDLVSQMVEIKKYNYFIYLIKKFFCKIIKKK